MFQSLAESILILSLAALDVEETFHIFVVLGLFYVPNLLQISNFWHLVYEIDLWLVCEIDLWLIYEIALHNNF